MDQQTLEQAFGRPFRLAGDNWKGNCPFHDEKSPSFYVHHDDYLAHCFGCDVSGDLASLYARYAHITSEKAREVLGITAEDKLRRVQTRDQTGSTVPRYIPESWLAPWKKEVHKYVIERGFTVSTLAAAGTRYDHCQKRQVFPHRDREGNLLGAVGRSCRGQDPKWHFYWNYNKGWCLYRPVGLQQAQPLIVVEGIFDALWLIQHGFTSVAACLGSHATRDQLAQIKGEAETVILGFDNDPAGIAGNRDLAERLRKTTRVLSLQWPPYAGDWMDLDREQIGNMINDASGIFKRRLRERSPWYLQRASGTADRQEPQVR